MYPKDFILRWIHLILARCLVCVCVCVAEERRGGGCERENLSLHSHMSSSERKVPQRQIFIDLVCIIRHHSMKNKMH